MRPASRWLDRLTPSAQVKFRFSVYLELCKKQVLLEMVEVSSSSWSWFGLWLAVDLWVRGVVTEYNHSFDTTAHMVVINCAIIIVGMFVCVVMASPWADVRVRNLTHAVWLLHARVADTRECGAPTRAC